MLLRRRRSPKTSRTCPTLLVTYDPDDRVEGAVFEVTDGELEMADDYEASDCRSPDAWRHDVGLSCHQVSWCTTSSNGRRLGLVIGRSGLSAG
jgi:hypothetical protein